MERKTIFITGSTGFVGKHLLREFNSANYQIYALTRKGSNHEELYKQSNVKYLFGDVIHIEQYSSLLSNCDYFIHIAGEKRDEKKMYKSNVVGMVNILKEIARYSNRIKFLYLSSAGVYGIELHPENNISENSLCYPSNSYERTKYQAEEILRKNKAGIKYTILRPSNIFGEFDNRKSLLNLLQALQKRHFFYLNKNAKVNYVYVKYLCDIIYHIIKEDHFVNETYNVNSPCPVVKFIELIQNKLDLNYSIKTLPKASLPLMYSLSQILKRFPRKYQFINTIKYRELTNNKIYSDQKVKGLTSFDSETYLNMGLNNLIDHYKGSGLI